MLKLQGIAGLRGEGVGMEGKKGLEAILSA